MEHSLNQRDGRKPSPASIEGSSTIKQEPLDEEMKEPKIEIPQEASFWECGTVDPLKEEIDIGETGFTVQDPFFMIEEIGIKVEPKVEKDEEIEDHGDTVDTSTKWTNLSDEVKYAGNCNVAKSPFLPQSCLEIEVLDEACVSSPLPTSQQPEPSRVSSPLPGPSRIDSPLPGPSRITSPLLGPSRIASPTHYPTGRPTTPPNETVRVRKRRRQEVNIAYTEEVLNSLRVVSTATQSLIERMSMPEHPLDSVLNLMRGWSPERQERCLARVIQMVQEENQDRFEQR
ncbi:uncharacterized protein LOC125768820 isoform X4 [Anopheles funestus]|uniref:uncharacterized protein LOC125768820 isoform X4 n=1 Tax=Anopheles funestus TaxID=62324 RepID=UPI0020C67838|nr:uncharacterized protein LOC125768820 isoform X4 [Anopheles funestus]